MKNSYYPPEIKVENLNKPDVLCSSTPIIDPNYNINGNYDDFAPWLDASELI